MVTHLENRIARTMAAKDHEHHFETSQARMKHPKYEVMVAEAIYALNSRQGSTRQAVTKHLTEKYQLDAATCVTHANKALKACIEKNVIESTTGDLKGKLKLSKDRKEELKKVGKKVEKKLEKKVTGEVEKAVKRPPRKPAEKRSSSKMDDKENEPSTKKRQGKGHVDETEVKPKRGKQQEKQEGEKEKETKSSSASKIDEMRVSSKSVKGRQKANEEMMEVEVAKKRGVSKKKKKAAE